jgi:hypothetical protein
VAEIARGLGLAAVSVHEVGRRGLPDLDQLQFAVHHTHILITRNRDDFRMLVESFFQEGKSIPGVLVVPRSLPNNQPERIAHAMKRWYDRRQEQGGAGFQGIDFLSR